MQLSNITEDDFQDIFSLTRQEKIMKYVGNGKAWNDKKVKNFIKYNLEEVKLDDKKRTEYYYKIVKDNLFAGIIGFHYSYGKYVLTVYLMKSKQGKGYFTQALELLMKKIKKYKPHVDRLYSQVYLDNEVMNKVMEKKYLFVGTTKLGRTILNEYIIFLRKNTYAIYPTYSSGETLMKILEKRGNWKRAEKDETIDFLYLEGKYLYDKSLYGVSSLMKNQTKIPNQFFFKNKLYDLLGKLDRDYLIETYNFTNHDKIKHLFDDDKIWIIKPVKGYAGKGIKVTKKYSELEEHLNTNKFYQEWTMQAYIMNPLLYENRKFHIRFYMMIDNENNYYVFRYGEVALAKELYMLTDFDNKNIHDTHFNHDEILYYPAIFKGDIELTSRIDKSIYQVVKDIKEKENHIQCYPENKFCYELFAIDAMVTQEYELKLLEINNKIGLPENDSAFAKELFESQISIALDKYFPPSKEITKIDYFIKIN